MSLSFAAIALLVLITMCVAIGDLRRGQRDEAAVS
jgi:hypothetical protein